jgi:hypothetical protein
MEIGGLLLALNDVDTMLQMDPRNDWALENKIRINNLLRRPISQEENPSKKPRTE